MDDFRVYYDDKGNIICYTCEVLEGNFITVDAQCYAESNPFLKVINGKLVRVVKNIITKKLIPSDTGVRCTKQNICIVVSDDYDDPTVTWNIKEYEFKPY